MLESSTLIDQVYNILRQRIVSGDLTPGQKLDVESISAELGISTTPVKDALRLLSADGLIDIRPRRGTYVTELTVEGIKELFDVRLMVELWAVERAVRNATAEDDQHLRKLLADTCLYFDDDLYSDARAFMEKDSQLHGYLVRLAGNNLLVEMFEGIRLNTRLVGVQAIGPIGDAQASWLEHSRIVDAFQKRSIRALKLALKQHEINRLHYWCTVIC